MTGFALEMSTTYPHINTVLILRQRMKTNLTCTYYTNLVLSSCLNRISFQIRCTLFPDT